jgi:iron complex transport system permease protein
VKVLDRRKMFLVNGVLFALLTLSVVGCALIGPVRLDLSQALRDVFSANPDAEIFFRARLPRVLLGAAIGGGMAACGVVLQAMLGNPLACPQMLGVSGGASLGGIVALIFFPSWLLPFAGDVFGEISWVPLAAFLGALLSMFLVYRFSLFHGRLHPYHLLLSGVILNSFIAAVIMFLNSIVDFYQAQGLLFWLMGSLSTRAYLTVAFIWAYIILGFLWLWTKGLSLNLITLGEEAAMQLGVETGSLQRHVFIASSLMIGAMVSVSGMIGFVGLMVPHVMRLLVGSDHRLLLPASFLGGGIFLCWADTLARIVLAPAELPVGIITAFLGGPFFLFLLYREGRRKLAL